MDNRREGAHNVLQIGASMISDEWDGKWLDLVLSKEGKVALELDF